MRIRLHLLRQAILGLCLLALPALGLSQSVQEFRISPESVQGGDGATGSIKLSEAAPAAGYVVTLSSNESSVAVPPSVTLAAGEKSATFAITTTAVTSSAVAKVTATDPSGKAHQAYLEVKAPFVLKLEGIAVDPFAVFGGKTATGYLVLNGRAPAGGFVVTLSSDQTFAQAPATVTLSEGLSTASFTITTTAVTQNSVATITATDPNGVKATTKLTVAAPIVAKVEDLGFIPESVLGGKTSTGVVALNTAAPTGGFVIKLSSNQTFATVPATVTVAAGAKLATFVVTTKAVTANGAATITATDPNGKSVSSKLAVTAPVVAKLEALGFTPWVVVGGKTATGVIALNIDAPAGGFVVTLSSNETFATVPATVTVAAGTKLATFLVTTTSVTANGSATITATGPGGKSVSAKLAVVVKK